MPSPDNVFTVRCCGHTSCWAGRAVTDAHGGAPGFGLPAELVEKGLDCGGRAVMGRGTVDEVAVHRVPSAAAGAGEGAGHLGRPHQSQQQTCNKPSWALPRASCWASSWRSDEKLESAPPGRFLLSAGHSLETIQCSTAEQRPLLSTEEAHGQEQGFSG